ncbi:MAG: 30S ribosomal protein S3, partial [Prevotella sp.]|nr:30S ribosomal protein S3 [Prevotella sp.]
VGLLGLKVWICRGEVYGKVDLAPNFTQEKGAARSNGDLKNGGIRFRNKINKR